MRFLIRVLLGLSLVGCGAASAEEGQAAQELSVTVGPSGFEAAPDEAQARLDRVARRMQASEYAFRNICTGCGRSSGHLAGINAPFNPVQVLGRPVGADAD